MKEYEINNIKTKNNVFDILLYAINFIFNKIEIKLVP